MSFGRILVPLSGSPESERALPVALRLACDNGAALFLLRVVPPTAGNRSLPKMAAEVVAPLTEEIAQEYLSRVALAITQRAPVEIYRAVVHGPVEQEILTAAVHYQTDLILMSRGASSRLERWFVGSTTETIMRKSQTPLLTVPCNPLPLSWVSLAAAGPPAEVVGYRDTMGSRI